MLTMELKTNGQMPRIDRVTDAALLAIGERAMDRYLKRVTDKVAKRTRPGSEGQERLKDYDVETAPGAVTGTVTLTPGLGLQEYGGILRARNVTYMAIPLKAALGADGTPKRVKARQWRNTRVITSARGSLLIVMKQGRRWVPLYALKREVRVRARLGLRKELRNEQAGFWKDVSRELHRLLRPEAA